MIHRWQVETVYLGKEDLDAHAREDLLYQPAEIFMTMMRKERGVVGDVARTLGSDLVAPPIDPAQIQRFLGDLKGFGAID